MELNSSRENNKHSSPWKEDEEAYEPREAAGSFNNSAYESSKSMKTFAKRIVLAVLLFAAGFGYYYFFARLPQPNVGLEFSKPDQTLLGQPFTVSVSFSNYSDQILKNAKLSVLLPDGISFLNDSPDKRVLEQAIGDLGPGSVNQQTFTLIALNGSQTLKHIDAKLAYETAGSSAEFQSKSGIDVPVGQPAVGLTFDAPQSVFSGENFDITVRYQNNSDRDFKNLRLKMDYPPMFQFVKSSEDASAGNNRWDLGTLPKGGGGVLTITGALTGSEQSYLNFHGSVTADILGQEYGISEQPADVSISASPLSVVPGVNGATDYVSRIGDELVYVLRYKNNSDTTFENITIKAGLNGELFDFSSIRTDASFDPITKTFTWIAANTPALAVLPPRQEGSVELRIKLSGNFPIRRISDRNYILKLHAEINSPTVPQGTNAQKTMSVASIETRVSGAVSIRSKALWRDAPSGILNKGPFPPVVNKPTQYTIHWLVSNYATDVSNIEVNASLQAGARWTGVVKTNIGAQPSYDPASGKIIWNIGNMAATKGVISPPAEAIFQIELTPAVNQVGQSVTFLSDTRVQGQDVFTNSTLTDSARALDTSLPDDATITEGNRTVQQ